jgi:uncharacterized membrane protein
LTLYQGGTILKVNHEIVINRSREEVWRIFDNPENMLRWQPTLQSFVPHSGQPGQIGAVSKLTYKENGRQVILTETITGRREPEEFAGDYSTGVATNHIKNRFIRLDDNKTRWVVESDVSFHGVLWKLAALFLKERIWKRCIEDMNRFKQLAESQEEGIRD